MKQERTEAGGRRPHKTEQSIAFSLSVKLFWEGVAGLLSGILFTLLLFALSLLIYAESSALGWAGAAVGLLPEKNSVSPSGSSDSAPSASPNPEESAALSPPSDSSSRSALTAGTVRMERVDRSRLPKFLPLLRSYLPWEEDALPQLCGWKAGFSGQFGDYWFGGEDKSPALRYTLYYGTQGEAYAVDMDLSLPVRLFTLFASVFVLVRLIELLTDLGKNRRAIGRMLRPIADFAEAAHSLNTSGQMSPEELRTLAGKLDQINAAHLDTRISVEETQRELRSLAAAINGMLDRLSEAYRSQALSLIHIYRPDQRPGPGGHAPPSLPGVRPVGPRRTGLSGEKFLSGLSKSRDDAPRHRPHPHRRGLAVAAVCHPEKDGPLLCHRPGADEALSRVPLLLQHPSDLPVCPGGRSPAV